MNCAIEHGFSILDMADIQDRDVSAYHTVWTIIVRHGKLEIAVSEIPDNPHNFYRAESLYFVYRHDIVTDSGEMRTKGERQLIWRYPYPF